MNAVKTLTLRLPLGIYERAAALAEARGQNLSHLFQDGLQLLDSQGRERQLFDDFSLIAAAGADESNVEFAVAAQAEALGVP